MRPILGKKIQVGASLTRVSVLKTHPGTFRQKLAVCGLMCLSLGLMLYWQVDKQHSHCIYRVQRTIPLGPTPDYASHTIYAMFILFSLWNNYLISSPELTYMYGDKFKYIEDKFLDLGTWENCKELGNQQQHRNKVNPSNPFE